MELFALKFAFDPFFLKGTERSINAMVTKNMATDLKECAGCNIFFDAQLLSEKKYKKPYLDKRVTTGLFCSECLSKSHVKTLLVDDTLQ